MSIDERQWDEMIIFLGKEMKRLSDRIEGWKTEEESDSGKEIWKKLGLEKLEPKDLREIIDRGRQRKKFIQNLKEILREAADE